MATSPTQRTLNAWRKEGFIAQVVEHWNPHGKVRNDLFGFVDVLAVGSGRTVGIQTTSYANVSARVRKIRASEYLEPLLDAGWEIVVEGWHKPKHRWECRRVEVKQEES